MLKTLRKQLKTVKIKNIKVNSITSKASNPNAGTSSENKPRILKLMIKEEENK